MLDGLEITDNTGDIGAKEKPWPGCHDFPERSYYFATPANVSTTLYVDISSASPFAAGAE